MSISNLQQNFNKGNSLPQSPGLIVRRMTAGSIFSGIGAGDWGFERAGFEFIWQVEKDDYCQGILSKYFPGTEKFKDVKDVKTKQLKKVDCAIVTFPCQDTSGAGKREGIKGKKSGLWFIAWRLLRVLRPRYIVVENVSGLLNRGMGDVLACLAEGGYDAEWQVLPAAAFGAPHLRERVIIVAYTEREGLEGVELSNIFIAPPPYREIWRPRLSESDTIRKRNAIANYVERITGLGNAWLPDQAEWVAKQILRRESALCA